MEELLNKIFKEDEKNNDIISTDISERNGEYQVSITIDTYKWLYNSCKLDEICELFNSEDAQTKDNFVTMLHELELVESGNTYNYNETFNRHIHYARFMMPNYIFFQVHNGRSDVRRGYSEWFMTQDFSLNPMPEIMIDDDDSFYVDSQFDLPLDYEKYIVSVTIQEDHHRTTFYHNKFKENQNEKITP